MTEGSKIAREHIELTTNMNMTHVDANPHVRSLGNRDTL